jgi:hypothetical protein
MFAYSLYQFMVVPLMDDYEISPFERLIQVQGRQFIEDAGQSRIDSSKLLERRLAVVLPEMRETPPLFGFIDHHLMTSGEKLGDNPSQKVSIPVIPVREKGMVEHHNMHS